MDRIRVIRYLVVVVLLLAASTFTVSAETLRVKVMSAEGHPLDGTTVAGLGVTLMRSPDPRVVQSGSPTMYPKKGPVIFGNVLPGIHAIRVSAPGYLPVTVGPIFIEERLLPKNVVEEVVVVLNRIKETR